jgi:hypothetical protein
MMTFLASLVISYYNYHRKEKEFIQYLEDEANQGQYKDFNASSCFHFHKTTLKNEKDDEIKTFPANSIDVKD